MMLGFWSLTRLPIYFNNFSDDLDNDLYQLNEDALEDENEFLESDAAIDLVNWHMSERWARPDFT